MADTKISALPAATDLSSASIPIVQSGANRKAGIDLFDARYAVAANARVILTEDTTYHCIDYPSPGGVGGGTGTGTALDPFVGPQFALDYLQKNIDTAGHNVRLEIDSDFVTENGPDGFIGLAIANEPLVGGGSLTIAFAGGSKCRCSTSGTGIINSAFALVTIEDPDFDGSDDSVYFTHIIADAGETDLVNPKFGKSGTADHKIIGFAAILTESGTKEIYGGGSTHSSQLAQGSWVDFSDVTFTGTIAFSTAYLLGELNAAVELSGGFTGSFIGVRYIGRQGTGIISLNDIPGSEAGQLDATSSYNFAFGLGFVPTGGTTGQVLAKSSDLDFETEWVGPIVVATPATASDPGTPGQLAYDDSYFYVCIDTDTWKRAALSTW